MSDDAAAILADKPHRGTIFVEDATVIEVRHYPGDQFVLRVAAKNCAAKAQPGNFVHIRCDDTLPMRRPLSIMRTNPDEGWIELLYKIVGGGLRSLSLKKPGDITNLVGPIGQPFNPSPERPYALLLGGGVGIPPMIFLAEHLKNDPFEWHPLAFMGSELPFPFATAHSSLPCPWAPDVVNAANPLLEEWGIPSRLASLSGFEGCYEGYVTDLARLWLQRQPAEILEQVELFACGPTPMLKAASTLAREFGVSCQVSLEEFMACAVGGCAGCAVEVMTAQGPAMKRVCVDGPVFDAAAVFCSD